MSRRGTSPIRTRGGSGIPTGYQRAKAFVQQHKGEVDNPRGLAKMFDITVAEAREIIEASK